jgi:hypothetical protein
MPGVMMDNEGGSFLTRKFAGIPAWVILAGVAALAYFLFMRNSGSSTTPTNSTSGGGGSIRTGKTTVQSGAVKINVTGGDGGAEKQPKPPHGHGFKTKSFVVPRDETLAQFASSRHWSQDTMADMANWKQPTGSTYAGQKLSPDFKLKKGAKIFRQLGN